MTTTLRLFVGERWPLQPTTHWALLGDAGELLRTGASGVQHWPAADHCEAVISVPQVSCMRAPIPEHIARRDVMTVVGSTLEDRLLEDLDQCHLTVCGRQQGAMDVLIVARTRLRNVLAQFAAVKRPLLAAYSEMQSCYRPEQGWTLAMAAEAAILHRPGQPPLALDLAGDMPPAMLPQLMEAARAQDGRVSLTVLPAPRQALDLAPWRTALGTAAVTLGPEYHWYELPGGAADLLHDEFTPSQRRDASWRAARPILIAAATVICAQVLVGLAQVGWQRHVVNRAEARMADLFRGSFPNLPVVAPVSQSRQQLDRLRTAHGLLRSDDALSMLAAVADLLGADAADAIREIKYENRRLSLVLAPQFAGRLEGLSRQLAARDYLVAVQSTNPDAPSLVVQQEPMK